MPQEEAILAEPDLVLFDEVEKLVGLGINPGDVKKLKEAGFFTLQSIQMVTKKNLLKVKGLSEGKADKILEAVSKTLGSGFLTGKEILERRAHVHRLSTGSEELDTLLGGGMETMSITGTHNSYRSRDLFIIAKLTNVILSEIFGEFRSGKTQICHTLCVTAQMAGAKVAFLDTEGTFRPERVSAIAERFGLNPDTVLDNILYARAYTHEQQMQYLTYMSAHFAEDPYRLLVVDSIIALFRVDFSGRGELSERQMKLNQMLSRLCKIAEEFNVCVLLTNQVMSDPGASAMFVQDPKKPVGGHVLAHASTTRIFLRKGRGDQRIAKIYDSPCLPESEVIFQISEGGIIDAKD